MALVFVSSYALAQDFDPLCIPTAPDSLGPYYVSGMPELENLNRHGKKGEKVEVVGVVMSAAKNPTPIANAKVEVWHSDGKYEYYPHGDGARHDYDDNELDLRGMVTTKANGVFRFTSIIPGTRLFGRPPHFHYKVSAANHNTLVTQHYVVEHPDALKVPCRSAHIERTSQGTSFNSPVIFLVPNG